MENLENLTQEQLEQIKQKYNLGEEKAPSALPDGKVLIQKFAKIKHDDKYSKANLDISNEMLFVEAGQGLDVISGNEPIIGDFNKNDMGGGNLELTPNAPQRAVNLSTTDTLKLKASGQNASDGFKQLYFTKQQILYIQNFLASNPEKYEEAIFMAEPSLIRYRYLLLANEIARLYKLTKSKNPQNIRDDNGQFINEIVKTNNVVGNSANFTDAIAGLNYLCDMMTNDNSTFAIGADGSNQKPLMDGILTNCENLDKLNIYMAPGQRVDLLAKLRNAAIRESNLGNVDASDRIKNIVERIKALPLTVKNPMRDVIVANFPNNTIYYQINLIEDSTKPNNNNYAFTELSSIDPIQINSKPISSNVAFGIFKNYGDTITATIDGEQVNGTFYYSNGSTYNTNIVDFNSALIIYANDSNTHDGISTLFNLKITNEQEWLKALAKDNYTTIGMNVVSANTTRMAVYTDQGFSKIASIDTN